MKYLISVLILAIAIIFLSCGRNVGYEGPTKTDDSSNFNSDAYTIYPDETEAYIPNDATLAADFDVIPYNSEQAFTESLNGNSQRWHCRHFSPIKRGIRFWVIFRLLDLNQRQMNAIKGFMKDYFNCKKRVWTAAQEEIRTILADAKRQKTRIINALRNGDLTRGQAMRRLAELNKNTREAIHNAVDQEALCRCLHILLRNIGSVLDEDQMVIWQRWVSHLQGPCFQRGND